jgi:hypothetical protein
MQTATVTAAVFTRRVGKATFDINVHFYELILFNITYIFL